MKWCSVHAKDWRLIEIRDNQFPYSEADPENTSQSNFYVFEKIVG
jgi:hypothetical protein